MRQDAGPGSDGSRVLHAPGEEDNFLVDGDMSYLFYCPAWKAHYSVNSSSIG